jgi:hypothetical protein
VSPEFPIDDAGNGGLVNAEATSKLIAANPARPMRRANFAHQFGRQLCRLSLLAAKLSARKVALTLHVVALAFAATAFAGHVGKVLGVGAEKQVFDANARRVVAAVADQEAIRNRPVGELPSNPVGPGRPTVSVTEQAVTFAVLAANPQPTAYRFAYVPVETF